MYKNVSGPVVYIFRLTAFVFRLKCYLVITIVLDAKYCLVIASTSWMSVDKIM